MCHQSNVMKLSDLSDCAALAGVDLNLRKHSGQIQERRHWKNLPCRFCNYIIRKNNGLGLQKKERHPTMIDKRILGNIIF